MAFIGAEAVMKRREFIAALLASSFAAPALASAQVPGRKPRLLIADEDPFTGVALLRSRYAAGLRPSDDVPGWALSWQLTGQNSFAHR
ncbi:MAG: hypothetical protein ABI164_03200, partial [Acidobacteriaceae bacterium]